MPLFRQKKTNAIVFDPETQIPAVRASICTGEKTAGFISKADGHFQEIMLLEDEKALERFCRACGTTPDRLKKIY